MAFSHRILCVDRRGVHLEFKAILKQAQGISE